MIKRFYILLLAIVASVGVFADNYTLVTDASTLADGNEIIITNVDVTYALSTDQQARNRSVTAVFPSEDIIVPDEGVQIVTLEATGANFMLKVGDNAYLYAQSDSYNRLLTADATEAGDNGKFAISIAANGIASVTAQGNNSHNDMRYYPGAQYISCYTLDDSVEPGLKIFKKEATPEELAAEVVDLINAIGTVEYTDECKAKIEAARAAYDALSTADKALVTNYSTLTAAEAAWAALPLGKWDSGDCEVILSQGGIMTVSKKAGEGNGAMDNYAKNSAQPWKDYRADVKSLVIESGVTELGSYAFYGLTYLEGDMVIPEGVTALHENTFYGNYKLTSVTLPSTTTLLGDTMLSMVA